MEKTTSIRSESWRDRANKSIAHGALTNSKRPASFVDGVYPTHLEKGEGCFVFDTNGKKYFDFIGGLGSCILGYANPTVIEEVTKGLRRGGTLSLGSTLEVEVAELVKSVVPFIDHVRFLKTGSEACSAAIRIARAHTGKNGILSHGYHGWSDEFVSLTPPGVGVPRTFENIATFDSPEPDLEGVAAVIIEPVLTDFSDSRALWLSKLRDHCTKNGTLLIYDEVITGFRVPKFTVAHNTGILPDIIVMGKACGNGLPISIVGGKREVMNGTNYFVSSTFAGDMAALSAAKATITALSTNKYNLHELWVSGKNFLEKFNSMWPEALRIVGYPTRGVFEGDPLTKALFFQECCKAGILFGPSFFFHFGHLGYEEIILSTVQDVFRKLKTSQVKLEGEMPQTPFAQKVRNQ